MTRYEECLRHVRAYANELRSAGLDREKIEARLRSYVEAPAFDVTFRAALVRDAMVWPE